MLRGSTASSMALKGGAHGASGINGIDHAVDRVTASVGRSASVNARDHRLGAPMRADSGSDRVIWDTIGTFRAPEAAIVGQMIHLRGNRLARERICADSGSDGVIWEGIGAFRAPEAAIVGQMIHLRGNRLAGRRVGAPMRRTVPFGGAWPDRTHPGLNGTVGCVRPSREARTTEDDAKSNDASTREARASLGVSVVRKRNPR